MHSLKSVILENDVSLLETLLRNGYTRSTINDQLPGGNTLLGVAATNGLVDVGRLLIQFGADVNRGQVVDGQVRSALFIAALFGFEEFCKMLVEHGADNAFVDPVMGCTAVRLAITTGNCNVIRSCL